MDFLHFGLAGGRMANGGSSQLSFEMGGHIQRETQGHEKRVRQMMEIGSVEPRDDKRFKQDREKHLQDQLLLQRDEFERALHAKEREVDALRESNQRAEEENHVLKRGIAIQSSRQREAHAQNAELQQVLARAAEHIHGLERIVDQLRTQVQCYESGGFNDMYMPPPHGDAF